MTATAQTITATSLYAEYAAPIANAVNLDPADYEATADGLSQLLTDTAECLSPMDQTRDWLEDAAADLDAIARLGGDDKKTRQLLKRVDSALYDARSELKDC